MERHDPGRARAAEGQAAGSTPGLPALRERVAAAPILPVSVDATWVEPGLYCTVDFLEWTEGGELRAPVFVELVGE